MKLKLGQGKHRINTWPTPPAGLVRGLLGCLDVTSLISPSSLRVWVAALPAFVLMILPFASSWTCSYQCELGPVVMVLSALGAIGMSTVAMSIPLTLISTPPRHRSLEIVVRLFLVIFVLAFLLAPRELLFGKFVIKRWTMRLAVLGAVALPVHIVLYGFSQPHTARWTSRLALGQLAVVIVGGLAAFIFAVTDTVPQIRDRWPLLGILAVLQLGSAIAATKTAELANPKPDSD